MVRDLDTEGNLRPFFCSISLTFQFPCIAVYHHMLSCTMT